MTLRRILGVWSCLFLVAGTVCALAAGDDAYVHRVELSRGERGDLVLSFDVAGAMTPRVMETLDSGLPVRFTYWIRIEHPREFARDAVLTDLKLVRVLEKDNLADRYRVSFEGATGGLEFDDLRTAVARMTRVRDLSLVPLAVLEDREPLFLRIKAQLQKFRLPFQLHYLFAFVSYWDVETDWYTLELPPPDRLP